MQTFRGRSLGFATGILAVLVAGCFLAANWRWLTVQYHCERLERARTYEEALPWLEALARESREARISDLIVENLGERRLHGDRDHQPTQLSLKASWRV